MVQDSSESNDRDRQVNEIISAYLEAVDAGQTPDRQEWLRRYPEFAAELEVFLADYEHVDRVAEPLRPVAAPGTPRLPERVDSGAPVALGPGQPAEPSVGATVHYFGDYELLEEIARGGMGVVYKARQISLNRIVAVKMILAGRLATKADRDRFHSEAQAAALLDHPNIVPVFEVGEHEGQHYFSMGYIDGQSLATRLAEGPLPPKEAAKLVAAVAGAVEYAHRQGVIHRDIKPSNIVIDSKGSPRITDFGLAKRVDSGSDVTATGQVLGTPSYMAPEQAAGQIHAVGPAADVYALGALLYAALTGRPPFQAATPLETLQQVLDREPVALRLLNAAVPRDLETICLKCLDKSVPRRYPTAQALAEDLRRYLEGRPIVARPVGRWEHAWRWCLRNRLVAALSAAAVLLLVIVAVVATAGYLTSSRALRQVVAAQVDTLRRAEISQVPYLIRNLEPLRAEITPQLAELLQQPDLPEKEHLRISLALVAKDESQVPYLRDRLLTAEPAELLVICAALLPYRERLTDELWKSAEDPAAKKENRLRVACALAAFDAESPRWNGIGKVLAEALVAENPLVAATWVDALRPVRNALLPALVTVFQNRNRSESERLLATGILADYAADNPQVLANLLMDADEKKFAVLFPTIKKHGGRAIASLTERLREKPAADKPETQDRYAGRQANLAIALLAMGEGELVWPLLRHTRDPSVRSYIIDRAAPLGLDPRIILRRLEEERDVSARRALILCLGEFETDRLPPVDRNPLIPRLLALYRDDPDAGIHGAAEWLLRLWKQADEIRRVEKPLATGKAEAGRSWYVNRQGQTMVVVRGPVEFLMGSPLGETDRFDIEQLHRRRIDHSLAIAAKSVTFEQYLRFCKDYTVDRKHAPTDDCPVIGTSWYMAAEYCNWLSKQEGLPEKEWCYEPNHDGRYEEGMKPASDFLRRTGYRLPTEAEFEYTCRAGAITRRHYGDSEELLGKYCWYLNNSGNRSRPVGSLKPNDLGLFDMHGNVFNWCEDCVATYPPVQGAEAIVDKADGSAVSDKLSRLLRGGAFQQLPGEVRCARRGASLPRYRTFPMGFRPARTCN